MDNYASFDSSATGDKIFDKGQGLAPFTAASLTLGEIKKTPFLFTSAHHKGFFEKQQETWEEGGWKSEVADLFFNGENWKRIQKQIKDAVWKETKGKFILKADQHRERLYPVLQSVYEENAEFRTTRPVREVKRLNVLVVKEIMPGILDSLIGYYRYLEDVNKPIEPLDRPMYVGGGTNRVLPSMTTTFF